MFYNRIMELNHLNKRYTSDKAEFIIVYGRRRVGKTELLKQFVRNKPHIYFLADLSSEKDQLASFTEKIYLHTGDPALFNNPFANWDALFSYLSQLASKNRLIVIIDEYQYLQINNRAISSIIQKSWDEALGKSKILLILCGSYISFMENELLAYKSPIYGRRTAQFRIEPLDFFDARLFFPKKSVRDQVQFFSILGGIPSYLLQFNPKWNVAKNISQFILQPDTFLYSEPHFLLMQELREPRNYFAILRAIAFGATRINEIVQASGLDRGMVVKYLETLQNLRIIKRELPALEEKPEKSRKGIYIILDNFFRFWFRFVFPNRGFLEEGRYDFVAKNRIQPFINQYMGPIFENIAIDFLKRLNRIGKLPFELYKIGRHWDKDQEIDIVGFDEKKKHLIIGACKWSEKKVGTNILNNLIERSSAITRHFSGEPFLVLFSKSGFTDALKQRAGDHLLLFDLNSFGKI